MTEIFFKDIGLNFNCSIKHNPKSDNSQFLYIVYVGKALKI